MTPQIVWFKRDLRVVDHRPLSEAAKRGPVVALYVIEPDYWRLPDSSARHWRFVNDCLVDLDKRLRELGLADGLTVRRGMMTDVLDQLAGEVGPFALLSHEETGNAWTFARDRAVGEYCRIKGVDWTELPQFGVIRRLRRRSGWAGKWDAMMAEPLTKAPQLNGPSLASIALPDKAHEFQPGGRDKGLATLTSFLGGRGEGYRAAMATPVEAFDSCSRLSPHLTWGSVSMRECYQAALTPNALNKRAIESFVGRLHWHCHFMQKLEDEPQIEFRAFHSAYEGMRPAAITPDLFEAYTNGETGYPFVDACLRALRTTGYMNFRARAMLVSFASYQLWQPWQATGKLLAGWFTDYEPGIHWSQIQMQSGTTGINQIRIYNPVKQGLDNDPEGRFVRQWVPELAAIDDAYIHEPWKAPNAGAVLGKIYPEPIVDLKAATAKARDIVWGIRKQAGFRGAADAVQDKHGSRKSGVRRPDKAKRTPTKPHPQGDLFA